MVTLAGLALGAAFLASGYLSFGQQGSVYHEHFTIVTIVGSTVLSLFALMWVLSLFCFFLVPDKFLTPPRYSKKAAAASRPTPGCEQTPGLHAAC